MNSQQTSSRIQPLDLGECLNAVAARNGGYRLLCGLLRFRARRTGGYIPTRLLRLLKPFVILKKPMFLASTGRGVKFVGDIRDNYSLHCLVHPDPDGELIDFLVSSLADRPGSLLDVGANCGLVAASVAKAVRCSDVQIHCFEPAPDTAQRAGATCALNGLENVKVTQAAVGATCSTSQFYIPSGQSEAASCRRLHFDQDSNVDVVRVPMVTLDSLYLEGGLGSEIRVLKIDVEGAEPEVIKGASSLLEACHPIVLIEYSPAIARAARWTCSDLLGSIGRSGEYRFFEFGSNREIHNGGLERADEMTNIICRPLRQNQPV